MNGSPTLKTATLSPRQTEVYELIRRYRALNAHGPTLAELAHALNVSPCTVGRHVRALQGVGAVVWLRHLPRSLDVAADFTLQNERRNVRFPIAGSVS